MIRQPTKGFDYLIQKYTFFKNLVIRQNFITYALAF
jgi:hypothetical protein